MLVSWGCQDKVPATDGGRNQQTFIPSQFWGQKSEIQASAGPHSFLRL